MAGPLRIAVSGIPRGHPSPGSDGNWLTTEQRRRIQALDAAIEIHEIPAQEAVNPGEFEILLAEGGNRSHYPGELDWDQYRSFFTPALKWVQICSTGFRDNLHEAIHAGKVVLTNAPGLHSVAIAESVLAAMLDHAKQLRQRRIDQGRHHWRALPNLELCGATVLILGLGGIGARVARLCQAFGMRVLGTRRRPRPCDGVDEVFPVSALEDYLPLADYLVVALPQTPETVNLLDAGALARLKPHAWLINVGRGALVDEAALLAALRAGSIGGACLDVFVREPLPEDHPYWDLDKLLLIPHDSHASPSIGERMVGIFSDNLQRYLAGQPLRNVCDPARGY